MEVTFIKGNPPPENHSVIFKGQPAPPGIPYYVFSNPKDFKEFQSEVRGKDLIDSFDVRQIRAGSSDRKGEATDQHLKIWRDRLTQEYSISYYASAIDIPTHVEFPFSMFNQEMCPKEGLETGLDFRLAAESKRKFSKAFSRSPTERTDSSIASSGKKIHTLLISQGCTDSITAPSNIFSRQQTNLTTATSFAPSTTNTSRMSVASFASVASDGSQTQTQPDRARTSLEEKAKKMKYLKIEFSDEEGSSLPHPPSINPSVPKTPNPTTDPPLRIHPSQTKPEHG